MLFFSRPLAVFMTFVIPFSFSMSQRYPFSHLSFGRMATGVTVSTSKQYSVIFSYERLDNLGVVQIKFSGLLGFLPKCAP